ncbi:hypothetical protein HYZ97_03075 [Candidatus Pacearchaeota archaeon]|nr:hypothetical protein [Candidatus Pacearchaeota archaeon]
MSREKHIAHYRKEESRRKFIRTTFKAGLCSLLLAGLATTVYRHYFGETYSQWYTRSIAHLQGRGFDNPSFLSETLKPNPEDVEKLDGINSSTLREGEHVLDSHYFKGFLFISLDDRKVLEEYSSKQERILDDFLSYIDYKKAPEIRFSVLTPFTQAISPSRTSIEVYVALQIKDPPLIGKYKLENASGKVSTATVFSDSTVAGEFNRNIRYVFGEEDITFDYTRTTPIVVSAGLNAGKSFNSPLSEVFHFLVQDATLLGTRSEANKLFKKK